MPSYRAITSGNWSATSTWNVWSGSAWIAATNVPSSADDAWANNFTVTIDQNVTVLSVRNTTSGAPGTGTTAGGGFQIITGGFTLTCTTTFTQLFSGTTNLITVNTTSGITTLNLSAIWNSNGSAGRVLTISGTSVVNINGNFSCGINSGIGCITTGPVTVNLVGNIIIPNYTSVVTCWWLAGGTTFNMTGNITPTTNGTGMQGANGISVNGNNFNVTINGNVTWENNPNQSNTAVNINLINLGANSGTLTINGNIGGGTIWGSHNAVNGSGTVVFTHNGICRGGIAGSAGSGNAGIFLSGVNSMSVLSGPFIFGDYGAMPFNCARTFFKNNINKYMEFTTNSTNGALFPAAAPTRTSMFSPNSVVDGPAPSNVRFGVVYANGTVVGTMRVPNPNQVSKGVQTDNTVGVVALSPQDVWGQLLANINTPNSIGERLKDAATVQSTGDQIASLQ